MKKKLTAICCAALLTPVLYAQGIGQAPILRPEYRTLNAQAEIGNAEATNRVYELAREGKLYERNNAVRDRVKAENDAKAENDRTAQRYLSRAAENGSILARYDFAVSRLSGMGSLRSGQKTAFEYLLELAKLQPSRNFTPEQYFEVHSLIGECYENGKGVQPNLDLAFRYYLFASVQNEKARLALARIFMKGLDSIGIKANPDAAMFEFFDVFTRNEKRIPEIISMLRAAGKVNDF